MAHARRVRLYHAERALQRHRRNADTRGRATYRGIARRHERIRAMIDVEHRPLCAFQQHGRATLDRAVHTQSHVVGQAKQPWCQRIECSNRVVHRRSQLGAGPFELGIRPLYARRHEFTQPRRIPKIQHAHTTARDLVFVGRTDAATSRADGFAGRARLVHELVVRHHQMGALAHVQPPLHVHTIGDQLVDFREQRLRVHDHAVADRTPHAGVQDAARDLVQHERFVPDMHGVAGIRPALIAHHPIGLLGEDIHQLALPLVAPLGTHYHHRTCRRIEHANPWLRRLGAAHKKRPADNPRGVREI